jgi:hypothetical protein
MSRIAGRPQAAVKSVVVVAAVLMMLGLSASVALATTGHGYVGQFGVAGSNDLGGFAGGGPAGVAVRQATGDVYASDPDHSDGGDPAVAIPRVERFDAAGDFQSDFTIDASTYSAPGAVAVDSSGAVDVVYVGAVNTVAGTGAVLTFSPAGVAGVPLSSAGSGSTFAAPVVLAIDPSSGTVFVSAVDTTTGLPVIDVYNSLGVFQSKFDGSVGAPGGAALTAVSGLAVDGSSRVYVADGQKVYRYSAAGAYQATVDDGSHGTPGAVTADASTDGVYVVESNAQVGVFSAGGAVRLNTFALAAFASGVGVNESTGTVYTADPNDLVGQRYAPFAGATVVTGAASGVDATSATLNGTINPEGVAGTAYHFEYGGDQSYGTSTADVNPGSASSDVAAVGALTGLLPNTAYHFRLVGVNPNGTIYGEDGTFTTIAGAPVVDGSPAIATAITSTGATLNGTVDPRGSDAAYHFDYGLDATYGSSTPDGGPLSGQGAQGASATVAGLAPGTTYHFRVVADNGTGGLQAGADQVLMTASATAASATDVTAVKATLTGVVNSHGAAAKYHFEYSGAGVSGSTAEVDASTADGDVAVTAASGVLVPSTTYTVKVVITAVITDSGTGATTNVTTTGAEGSFTTDPVPSASTGAVTGVTTSAATFSGSYDTNGHSGSYQFVIGSSTSSYLAKTDPVAVSGSGTASGALDKLPAGQTYQVRLAVTSDGATTSGDTVTFATPAQPSVLPAAPVATTATASPYGCTTPTLAAYDVHPMPGTQITITGTDLGVGGTVILGASTLTASSWSVNGFTITVPEDASGSLALTVNCGAVSNTIAIQIYQAPSNTFTTTAKASKTTSTVTVTAKVPGPGTVTVSAGSLKTATRHAGAAGTTTIKTRLTAKAARSLKRHHKLTVTLKVRFTPAGGTGRTITKTITYTRKAGR